MDVHYFAKVQNSDELKSSKLWNLGRVCFVQQKQCRCGYWLAMCGFKFSFLLPNKHRKDIHNNRLRALQKEHRD